MKISISVHNGIILIMNTPFIAVPGDDDQVDDAKEDDVETKVNKDLPTEADREKKKKNHEKRMKRNSIIVRGFSKDATNSEVEKFVNEYVFFFYETFIHINICN